MSCALLPPVTLHFYLIFPRPKKVLVRHPRWVLALLYGPALVFLLLMLSAYLRLQWLYPNGGSDSPYEEAVALTLQELLWETYVYFVFAAVWYLASVVSLLHSFFTAADAVEKNQVKWILFGAPRPWRPSVIPSI